MASEAHETALVNLLAAVAQLSASQRGVVTVERTGPSPGELSIAGFRDEPVKVTPETIRELA